MGVVAVVVLAQRPSLLVTAVVSLTVAVGAAAYAVTRSGARRALAVIVAVLALIMLVAAFGGLLLPLVVTALIAVAGTTTRYALGRDLASLKSGPTPGVPVAAATHPVLILNPRSGGGKVERFGLVDEARRRGIEAIVLTPGDDVTRLARDAVARGADVIGMAGGDGSQALVAGVAMRHDIGYVCVPAGTRNHLAMDLGLDRTDVAGALDAFGDAVERRIDLGMVGDRVFVNNATMGLYARIVQAPEYRDRKVGTALEMLPRLLGPDATPFDLRFTGPDGTDSGSVHLILVSNNRYELRSGEGFGSRRRIDAGILRIVAGRFRTSNDIAWFMASQGSGRARRPRGWVEWSTTSFEVRSGAPVEVGVDGEALRVDPPVRFRIVPAALRVRIPRHALGYSPAAAASTPGWATITALLQTAAGQPVAIDQPRSTEHRAVGGSTPT
ncbi:MAG TPA: diacylglycerol kinase family protein [Euzebyales bacterium]|nr:diacylglycerol kinase family protein [Euzebyales bacterium]